MVCTMGQNGTTPIPGSREERIALLRAAAAAGQPIMTAEQLQRAVAEGAMTAQEIEQRVTDPEVRERLLAQYRAITGATGMPRWVLPVGVVGVIWFLMRGRRRRVQLVG